MSRKHGRKHDQNKPNKDEPSGIEGNLDCHTPAANTDAPHSEPVHTQSQGQKEPTPMIKRPDWVAIFTAFLAFFALASTIVVALQLRDSHRNFVVDERAWLSLESDNRPELQEGQTVTSVLHVANTGKTPASNIVLHIALENLRSGESPRLKYDIPHWAYTSGMQWPNGRQDFTTTMFVHQANGFVVLTPEMHADLVSGKSYLALYGKASYFDIFGKQHWVQLCRYYLYEPGTYNAEECSNYNSVDTE